MAILSVYDKDGNRIEIPAIKGDTPEEIAEMNAQAEQAEREYWLNTPMTKQ